jgi:hypothetical protein
VVFHDPPAQSRDCNRRNLRKKIQNVPGSVVALLQSYDSTNVGLGRVSVFVTSDSHILLQAADNLDAVRAAHRRMNATSRVKTSKYVTH